MNSTVKNVLCLTLITIVAGFGLGYVYDITKLPIAQMEESTKMAAYRSVFPEAAGFSENLEGYEGGKPVKGFDGITVDSVVCAQDQAGKTIGYVMNITTKQGYGGDITISMGIDSQGTVKGVEILDISETAGLGMKAKESKFRDQFKDKTVTAFTYTKTGAASDFEIDAISGATITTKAVVNAVNSGIALFNTLGGAQ